MRARGVVFWVVAASMAAGCASRREARTPAAPTDAADLPAGPVARPAGTTTTYHIRTAIVPVGSVPYDGQVLPLASPDGRRLAVEDGEPPSWPALLAEDGAEPPSSTRISVYDMSVRPLKRVDFSSPLLGLLLGRAADNSGFLVEAPRSDGARWIGKVSWTTGAIDWLVAGPAINAHATLTADGALLYTRRTGPDMPDELVLRTASGAEFTLAEPGASFRFPIVASDGPLAYAILQSRKSTDIVAVRTNPPLGPVVARRTLSSSTQLALAYQIVAPVQASSSGAMPAIYHPGLKRMAVFDPMEGTLFGLAKGSVGAAYWTRAARPGFFCTSPQGVVFTPLPTPDELASLRPRPPDARILASPSMVRTTENPERPIMLLGPDARDPRRLGVTLMHPDDGPLPER